MLARQLARQLQLGRPLGGQLARSFASTARPLNAAASSSTTSEVEMSLPYAVERSRSGNLPVYSDFKNGGNNARTIVRKIHGDAAALRDDLAQYLADGHIDPLRAPPAVILKPTSRQVEVKGKWTEEVRLWLEARGF